MRRATQSTEQLSCTHYPRKPSVRVDPRSQQSRQHAARSRWAGRVRVRANAVDPSRRHDRGPTDEEDPTRPDRDRGHRSPVTARGGREGGRGKRPAHQARQRRTSRPPEMWRGACWCGRGVLRAHVGWPHATPSTAPRPPCLPPQPHKPKGAAPSHPLPHSFMHRVGPCRS